MLLDRLSYEIHLLGSPVLLIIAAIHHLHITTFLLSVHRPFGRFFLVPITLYSA